MTSKERDALTPETAPTMADMQRMTDDLLADPNALAAYMSANPLPFDPYADHEPDPDILREDRDERLRLEKEETP